MRCFPILLLLVAVPPACNSDRFEREALENADSDEREKLAPLRDSLLIYLRNSLQVPQETLDRMLVNLGQNCALLIDPADPADCLVQGGAFGSCRATLAVRGDEQWAIKSTGTFGSIEFPDQCHMGIAYDGEFRDIDTLLRHSVGAQ